MWVDASFAVHPDMKSHTGGMMTPGKGAVGSQLVGVDDVMPQLLWTRHFLAAQIYSTAETVICQDNHSAMLRAKTEERQVGSAPAISDIFLSPIALKKRKSGWNTVPLEN